MAGIRVTAFHQQDETRQKDNVHLIPCKIKYTGNANVAEYFEKSMKDSKDDSMAKNGIKEASFRGRPLKGKDVVIPFDYEGLLLKEERKPYSDEEERTLTPKAKFDSFCYWNLDNRPTENDNIFKALKWIDISQVLHGPYDVDDGGGTPEATPTDR